MRRFITQEVNLFKRRLERVSTNPNDYKEFMRKYGLKFDLVSREERDEKRDRLIGLSDVTENNFINTSFYRYVQRCTCIVCALYLYTLYDMYIYSMYHVPYIIILAHTDAFYAHIYPHTHLRMHTDMYSHLHTHLFTYSRIPFQQALTLISKREVYLEAGLAWVPQDKLVSIITTKVMFIYYCVYTICLYGYR